MGLAYAGKGRRRNSAVEICNGVRKIGCFSLMGDDLHGRESRCSLRDGIPDRQRQMRFVRRFSEEIEHAHKIQSSYNSEYMPSAKHVIRTLQLPRFPPALVSVFAMPALIHPP